MQSRRVRPRLLGQVRPLPPVGPRVERGRDKREGDQEILDPLRSRGGAGRGGGGAVPDERRFVQERGGRDYQTDKRYTRGEDRREGVEERWLRGGRHVPERRLLERDTGFGDRVRGRDPPNRRGALRSPYVQVARHLRG